MTDPTCEPYLDDLPLYITGDLLPGETTRLEAHVAGCHECANALAAQQRAIGRLAQLRPEDVPAGIPGDFFDSRIAPRLQRSPAGRWNVGLKLAALVLVFVSGMAVRGGLFSDSGESEDRRQPIGASRFLELFGAEGERGNDLSRGFVALARLRRE